jgi:PmbA protein
MHEELVKSATQVLDLAKKAGSQEAGVKISRSRFVDMNIRDGEPDKASASTRRGLSLRLFVDGRFAVHTTSDLRPQGLAGFVADAAELTRALEPDPLRSLPDPARYPHSPPPELKIHDPNLEQASAEYWADQATQMEAACARAAADAGPEVVSVTGGAYGESAFGYLADSNGFHGVLEETGGFAGCSVVFMDPEQEGKRRMGWWWEGSRHLAPICGKAKLESIAKASVKRGLQELGAKPGPSGRYPLVVENHAARTLLGHIVSVLAGSTLHNKRSYLAGQMDKPVASRLLNLSDQPLLPGGLGSRWFDSEGAASIPLILIKDGKLKNYFLNTYYSRKLGMKPTVGSLSNIVLEPSHDQDFQEMLSGLERGLAVTGFLGGNFNSTTGDFSLGLKGLWIEDGKVAHPVEGMNMAGNAMDLWRGLSIVGCDAYPFSTTRSPSLRFDDVQLSGA